MTGIAKRRSIQRCYLILYKLLELHGTTHDSLLIFLLSPSCYDGGSAEHRHELHRFSRQETPQMAPSLQDSRPLRPGKTVRIYCLALHLAHLLTCSRQGMTMRSTPMDMARQLRKTAHVAFESEDYSEISKNAANIERGPIQKATKKQELVVALGYFHRTL